MDDKLPDEIKNIFEVFEKAHYQLYLVGGSVRDLLMDRPTHDWDFTTNAKPEDILKLFPDGFYKQSLKKGSQIVFGKPFYNNKFGTVGVPVILERSDRISPQDSISPSGFQNDNTVIEITTMRKEGDYRDFRHPVEVSWTNKIEEDLQRRDFTINALAMTKDENIIDPFGGKQDLELGLVKAVGNPNQRFKEDALRLMRAIRIAGQLDFEIESQTLKSIEENKELIKEIASERIRDELFKILGSNDPYLGIKFLKDTGLLKIILPEVEDCFGIVQEGPKHDRIYDIGEHSLLTMKFTPTTDPLVRLAALLHDIGKVKTFKKDAGGNVTFYNHDAVGAEIVLEIAKRFNLSKAQTDKIYRLVRYHMFTTDENQTDSAIRRFVKNIGTENIDDMFALRVGDRLGGGTQKAVSWRMEKYRERITQVMHKPFSVTDLKVNGEDVMKTLNIPPGRKVGEILNKLFEEILEDSSKNDRDYLIKRISEING